MAKKNTWILFDTWRPSTSTAVDSELFQVVTGADANHARIYTNMRGAGALPQSEKFLIKGVGVNVQNELAQADLWDLWTSTYLSIRVNDELELEIPLICAAYRNGFEGVIAQTAAADRFPIGRVGDGYMLDIPIPVAGGTGFKVTMHQELALAAERLVYVMLFGELERP